MANGVRIVSQYHPGLHSAAIGLWLHGGSRHQSHHQSGYAHLLEHLLFKGTKSIDGKALRQRFSALGGAINAQTGREFTVWYGLVLASHVRECLALLVEMLLEPHFTDQDVRTERQVVLREIDEEPPDLTESCLALLWPRHPLGWPVRGHRDVLEKADGRALSAYLIQQCQGRRLAVVAAGAVDHDTLLDACQPLARLPVGTVPKTLPPLWQMPLDDSFLRPNPTQLLWLISIPGIRDSRYTAFQALVYLLAGGPASRLYQVLRERHAWVYGFDSAIHGFTDIGIWLLRARCEPDQANLLAERIRQEFRRLATEPPTLSEMKHCREHFHARVILEQDDPQAVMERLGRETLLLGEVRNPAKLHDEIERLQAAKLAATASELLCQF